MKLEQTKPGIWEFQEKDMPVPGRIFANETIINTVEQGVIDQVKNVSKLPGIKKASMVMPDAHYGYGFPIGGVAAFDLEDGVISPGGVGYDINCGVRLLTTNLKAEEVRKKLKEVIDKLFKAVPSGVGSKGRMNVNEGELREICETGSKWAILNGYGVEEDLEHTEENGCIFGADSGKVFSRAIQRGKPQLGTLGSGNHFLEVQEVEQVFDKDVAEKFGLVPGNAAVMIHCGSRGMGYQIADDYIAVMLNASKKYGIDLPDRQLACAPLQSQEATDYVCAMNCGVNYAFCNRQIITHWVRETFKELFKDAELKLLYDVCHNVAKFEDHGERLCVHRKGATRAFPAGSEGMPKIYKKTGHPVIIPGDMGTASYVLVGTENAMEETFGSTCHGAGRVMSRKAATEKHDGMAVIKRLESRGQVVRAASPKVLAEEASEAYKDIDDVIKSVELPGISRKIVRLKPMGVAKG